MGSLIGVQTQKANRLGLSLRDYQVRLATEKWCTGCKAWHGRSAFARDRTRADGLAARCRETSNATGRERYVRHPADRHGPPPKPDRAGDKRQARARVNHHVDVGRLPDPNTLPCADCAHAYVDGGKRHEYDHHEGYKVGAHLTVEAVCTTCHHARERRRKAA